MELYEYQERAVSKAESVLKAYDGFAFLCEAGSGKTLMAVTLLNRLIGDSDNCSVLIVCRRVLIKQWEQEVNQLSESSAVFTYEAFDTLSKQHGNYFDYIVVDESHNFKVFSTKRYKMLIKLQKPNQKRIILTGTPIDGKPEQFAPQFTFMDPSIFGSYTRFKDNFCVTDHNNAVVGYKNQSRFRVTINKFSAKAKPEGLPDRTDVYLSMNPSQKVKDSIKHLRETMEWKGSNGILMPIHAQAQYDVAEHTLLSFDSKNIARAVYKLHRLHKKLIVVYHFQRENKQLKFIADKLDINWWEFSTGKNQKDQFIAADSGILIAQQQVLGEGVDGLQHGCNAMLLVSYGYSSTRMVQVQARIHRIGQKNKCYFYTVYHKGYVTEKIKKALKNKDDYNSIHK